MLVGWLGFTALLFTGQRLKGSLFDSMATLTRADTTTAELEAALATGDMAQACFVVDDPLVGELRGLLLRRLGRHADAEAALLGTFRARGHMEFVEASLSLAMYCLDPKRQQFDVADRLVSNVLHSQPQNPTALQMRGFLDSRPK